MAPPHISDDDLELLALGRLPESAAGGVEEHLLVCGGCQARLADWDTYVRAMRAATRVAAARFSGAGCQPAADCQSAKGRRLLHGGRRVGNPPQDIILPHNAAIFRPAAL
jgi:anti-sigma factor RsiW